MKLEDCSKDELIAIIKKCCEASFISKFKIERCLAEVEYKRNLKTISEADNWNVIAANCRRKYAELLAPYANKKLVDIPLHIIREADQCLKDARRADREWDLCMKRLGD